MLGLNDRYLALHPPAGIGKGYTGHELGDGKYVLSRKPDLIAFWTPVGGEQPQWRSGREMVKDPSFRTHYQAVTFQADAHTRARLWVRRIDGRIGMQVTPQSVTVPALLLDAGHDTPVSLGAQRRPVLTLAPRQSGRVRDVPLTAGTWRFSVVASGQLDATLQGRGTSTALVSGGSFVWPGGRTARAQIRVSAGPEQPATLESLVFTRVTASH
jgi:hypothetical protein